LGQIAHGANARILAVSKGLLDRPYVVDLKIVFLFVLFFAIYKCIYQISIYNARKPREANKAYVKDYLKDTKT